MHDVGKSDPRELKFTWMVFKYKNKCCALSKFGYKAELLLEKDQKVQ